jgi:hypothetical protein
MKSVIIEDFLCVGIYNDIFINMKTGYIYGYNFFDAHEKGLYHFPLMFKSIVEMYKTIIDDNERKYYDEITTVPVGELFFLHRV